MDDIVRSRQDRANPTSKIATIKLLLKLKKSLVKQGDLALLNGLFGIVDVLFFTMLESNGC
jgi:hypothetical protein